MIIGLYDSLYFLQFEFQIKFITGVVEEGIEEGNN